MSTREQPADSSRPGVGPLERPLLVAVVNDYEVIVRGVSSMLQPFAHRVRVTETDVGGVPQGSVDIALFDTFGGHRTILRRAQQMAADHDVTHVVLYTWSADANLLALARSSGVSGVLSKARTAAQLVDGLERISLGEQLGFDAPLRIAGQHGHLSRLNGVGAEHRALGQLPGPSASPLAVETAQLDLQVDLTAREQEVLAMLGLGLSNRDIADELFLGVETVRTYVRQVFQKLGVKNRTQAAVRARVLGFEPAAERRPAAS